MRGTCGERSYQHGKENQGQGDTSPERPGPVRQGDSQITGNREAERGRGAVRLGRRGNRLSGRGGETRRRVCLFNRS